VSSKHKTNQARLYIFAEFKSTSGFVWIADNHPVETVFPARCFSASFHWLRMGTDCNQAGQLTTTGKKARRYVRKFKDETYPGKYKSLQAKYHELPIGEKEVFSLPSAD